MGAGVRVSIGSGHTCELYPEPFGIVLEVSRDRFCELKGWGFWCESD